MLPWGMAVLMGVIGAYVGWQYGAPTESQSRNLSAEVGMNIAMEAATLRTSATQATRASAAEAWASFQARPWNHPLIPPVSFAGARSRVRAPADPQTTIAIRPSTDDATTIQQALDAAAPGTRIELAAGRFVLDRPITLRTNGVALVGAGQALTTIHLARPLADVQQADPRWSWSGGFLQIGQGKPDAAPAATIGWIDTLAEEGHRRIAIAGATASYRVDQDLILTWHGDRSLGEYLGMPTAAWNSWNYVSDGTLRVRLTNRIAAIDAGGVVLAKPLRLPIRPPWRVSVEPADSMIRDIHVGGFTLTTARQRWHGHLRDPGWNGIMLDGAIDVAIADITMSDVDNGIFLRNAHHCSVLRTRFIGGPCHHAINLSGHASDNLVRGFDILCKVFHGISVQDLASGNVFADGRMAHGTFDSHRGLPFDTVRTAISIFNDGRPGGSANAGPYAGRRTVHWNIAISATPTAKVPGRWIDEPHLFPNSLLVDIAYPDRPGSRQTDAPAYADLHALQTATR